MKSWSKPEGSSHLSLTHESVAQNVFVCCLEPVNRISHPDNKKRTHRDLGTLQKHFPIGAKLKNTTFYCCLRQLQHENRRKFTRQAAGEKQAVKPVHGTSVFFLSRVAAHMLLIISLLPGNLNLLKAVI